MVLPNRRINETAEAAATPPSALEPGHAIVRVVKAEGKNLYSVEKTDNEQVLVELPARFRSTLWIKRGGFVVIDTAAFGDRENKLAGEITNVVRNEKLWRKQSYWYV
jgi:probable RNA-binding protein EIF1AD